MHQRPYHAKTGAKGGWNTHHTLPVGEASHLDTDPEPKKEKKKQEPKEPFIAKFCREGPGQSHKRCMSRHCECPCGHY
jgi:hypothetical protein